MSLSTCYRYVLISLSSEEPGRDLSNHSEAVHFSTFILYSVPASTSSSCGPEHCLRTAGSPLPQPASSVCRLLWYVNATLGVGSTKSKTPVTQRQPQTPDAAACKLGAGGGGRASVQNHHRPVASKQPRPVSLKFPSLNPSIMPSGSDPPPPFCLVAVWASLPS